MSEPAGGFYYLPASMLAWKVTKSRPNLWIRSSNNLAERSLYSLKGNSFNLYTALKQIIMQWCPPISSWVGWPVIKWFIYLVFLFLIIILIGNRYQKILPSHCSIVLHPFGSADTVYFALIMFIQCRWFVNANFVWNIWF